MQLLCVLCIICVLGCFRFDFAPLVCCAFAFLFFRPAYALRFCLLHFLLCWAFVFFTFCPAWQWVFAVLSFRRAYVLSFCFFFFLSVVLHFYFACMIDFVFFACFPQMCGGLLFFSIFFFLLATLCAGRLRFLPRWCSELLLFCFCRHACVLSFCFFEFCCKIDL